MHKSSHKMHIPPSHSFSLSLLKWQNWKLWKLVEMKHYYWISFNLLNIWNVLAPVPSHCLYYNILHSASQLLSRRACHLKTQVMWITSLYGENKLSFMPMKRTVHVFEWRIWWKVVTRYGRVHLSFAVVVGCATGLFIITTEMFICELSFWVTSNFARNVKSASDGFTQTM